MLCLNGLLLHDKVRRIVFFCVGPDIEPGMLFWQAWMGVYKRTRSNIKLRDHLLDKSVYLQFPGQWTIIDYYIDPSVDVI